MKKEIQLINSLKQVEKHQKKKKEKRAGKTLEKGKKRKLREKTKITKENERTSGDQTRGKENNVRVLEYMQMEDFSV